MILTFGGYAGTSHRQFKIAGRHSIQKFGILCILYILEMKALRRRRYAAEIALIT